MTRDWTDVHQETVATWGFKVDVFEQVIPLEIGQIKKRIPLAVHDKPMRPGEYVFDDLSDWTIYLDRRVSDDLIDYSNNVVYAVIEWGTGAATSQKRVRLGNRQVVQHVVGTKIRVWLDVEKYEPDPVTDVVTCNIAPGRPHLQWHPEYAAGDDSSNVLLLPVPRWATRMQARAHEGNNERNIDKIIFAMGVIVSSVIEPFPLLAHDNSYFVPGLANVVVFIISGEHDIWVVNVEWERND